MKNPINISKTKESTDNKIETVDINLNTQNHSEIAISQKINPKMETSKKEDKNPGTKNETHNSRLTYKQKIILIKPFLLYIFGYAAVYTLYDFLFLTIKDILDSGEKHAFTIQLFNFLKMIGSIYITMYAQKHENHRKTFIICLILYIASLLGMLLLCMSFFKHLQMYTRLILVLIPGIVYFFSLGGICPLIDSITMTILDGQKLIKYYPYVRIGGTTGHLISYFPSFILKNDMSKEMKILLSCLHSMFTIFVLMFVIDKNILKKKTDISELNIKQNNQDASTTIKDHLRKTNSFKPSTFLKLIKGKIGLLSFIILAQGFMRAAMSTHQRDIYKLLGLKEKDGNFIKIIRLGIELFLFVFIGFKSYVKIYDPTFCLLIASIFGCLRIVVILFGSEDASLLQTKAICMLSEICKSIFAGFYGYSSTKLSYDLAPPGMVTTSLGWTSSIYTGGSNGIYAIFGLIFFSIIVYIYGNNDIADNNIINSKGECTSFYIYKILFSITLCAGLVSFPLLFMIRRLQKKEQKEELNINKKQYISLNNDKIR